MISTTVMLSENVNAGFGEQINYGSGTNVEIVNWGCPHPFNTSFFVRGPNMATNAVVSPAGSNSPPSAAAADFYRYELANERRADDGRHQRRPDGHQRGNLPVPEQLPHRRGSHRDV